MNLRSTVDGSRLTVKGSALTVNRRLLTVNRRKGFALLEVLIAVLFIAIFMLVLLQVRNRSLHHFIKSGDQHAGSWLAEMKMAELLSQDLPDPEDDATWVLNGNGDFSEFDERSNELNREARAQAGTEWVDRNSYAKFEYEWTKELLFIGPNFIGNKEALDLWEQPLDENGEPVVGEEDPMEKPAARVVRVTLTVWLPEHYGMGSFGEPAEERPSITLVTYVDPAILFDAEGTQPEAPPEG